MNAGFDFILAGTAMTALPEGALWLADHGTLCVSDLHLGKSDRIARRSGRMLPPYETRATLDRLGLLIDRYRPQQVICLGDSFDDLAAAHSLDEAEKLHITMLQAGRDWVWIEGNHDPGPTHLGGRHLFDLKIENTVFRHIAEEGASGEISGHYHPKCSLQRGGSRPAFLIDANRVIMPAFGTFTGGLRASHSAIRNLMQKDAIAVLTGRKALPVPFRATC